jgi:hypothetical protein
MKRLFGIFVLTPAEQRVVILVVLLLVAFAWFKHQRDLSYESAPPSSAAAAPVISPSPAER